jgi:hypothetical protein
MKPAQYKVTLSEIAFAKRVAEMGDCLNRRIKREKQTMMKIFSALASSGRRVRRESSQGRQAGRSAVQQSTKVELFLNLKTAKSLGITVPLPLSGRADEVFE